MTSSEPKAIAELLLTAADLQSRTERQIAKSQFLNAQSNLMVAVSRELISEAKEAAQRGHGICAIFHYKG
jgi:uncharacterized phage-associated protein